MRATPTLPSSSRTIPLATPAATARSDRLIVAGLCVVTIALELHLSRQWFLGFDDTWHVFIAGVEPFHQFMRELQWEAHPPLSYFLLRWVTPLHGSILWPRLTSIVPSIVTVVLAYRCAVEMRLARPVTILAALLFAVSSAHLSMAITVRAYSLSTMLTMAAYLFLLRIVRASARDRRADRLGFVIAALLAVWTEYSALLAVGALVATLAIEVIGREVRPRAHWAGYRLEILVFGSGMAGLWGWMRWSQGTGLVGHLPKEYFRAANESLGRFALRGAAMTLDLFVPAAVSSSHLPGAALALLGVAIGCLVAQYARSRTNETASVRRSAILVLALVWAAIFVLATQGAYPYGGRLRHQFVLFPFLAFVGLLVLDEIHRRLSLRIVRGLVCVAVAVGIVATSAAALPTQIEECLSTSELWPGEIRDMMARRRDDDAIYAGQLNVIALFSHLKDRRWTAVAHDDGHDLLVAETRDAPPITVLRETMEWWLPSPLDAAAAKRLSQAMRGYAVARVWVMAIVLNDRPLAAERRDDAPIRALLSLYGLELEDRIVFASGEMLHVTLGETRRAGRFRKGASVRQATPATSPPRAGIVIHGRRCLRSGAPATAGLAAGDLVSSRHF